MDYLYPLTGGYQSSGKSPTGSRDIQPPVNHPFFQFPPVRRVSFSFTCLHSDSKSQCHISHSNSSLCLVTRQCSIASHYVVEGSKPVLLLPVPKPVDSGPGLHDCKIARFFTGTGTGSTQVPLAKRSAHMSTLGHRTSRNCTTLSPCLPFHNSTSQTNTASSELS
jgi:hypothetical protein